MTDIIFAYGLTDEETAASVRETLAAHDWDIELAALDYANANPNASLEEIEAAIRSIVGDAQPDEILSVWFFDDQGEYLGRAGGLSREEAEEVAATGRDSRPTAARADITTLSEMRKVIFLK